MLKKIPGLILSLLLLVSLSQAGTNGNTTETEKHRYSVAGADTVHYHIDLSDIEDEIEEEEEEELMEGAANFEMSYLYSIPAYNIYNIWDTVKINPYRIDITKKIDPTTLILKDENYNCGYYHPISGIVTSKFGKRKSRFHYGMDIDLETGDTVRSAFEGTVRVARVASGYGNVVVIRHNNGLETLYGHLSEIKVQIGQHLEGGEILGLGGNTGRSTGSHLHFEVRYKGQPIDPSTLISFQENSLLTDRIEISNATFKYIADYKAEAAKKKFHKVRKGDTLSRIAKRYGTTTSKLCKLNKIKTKTVLKVGRAIRYA